MIHIATVHWQTDKWIDIQKRHLDRFINDDYRIYAFLNQLKNNHSDKFYYSCTEPISNHAVKLNILADIIFYSSDNLDDLLIFIDGDAFPIGDILALIREKIKQHKLLAIQRIENNGDLQPHPSFCATTVGFWKEVNGDWKPGYRWKNNQRKSITDVGGNLLKALDENRIGWYKMRKTGQLANHPLWFSIYDRVIYHHASGFRMGPGKITNFQEGYLKVIENPFGKFLDIIPNDLIIKIKYKIHPKHRFRRKIYRKYKGLNEKVYTQIKEEDPFSILKSTKY